MPARPAIPSVPPTTQSWVDIEQLVDALAKFAQTDISLVEFAGKLLEHLQRAVAASGGAIWLLTNDHAPRLLAQASWPEALLAMPRLPGDTATEVDDGWLIGHGVSVDAQPTLLLEMLLPADRPPRDREDARRLLPVFGEIAADFLRRQELRSLRERETTTREMSALLLRLHQSLDLRTTAYTIANDGRQWLRADRVSVALLKQGKAKVWAISGIDELDPQADEVQRLARLARAVGQLNEPLAWNAGDQTERLPQLDAVLHDYLDQAHAARIFAVPLAGTAAPLGVLVAEWFSEQASATTCERQTSELGQHAAVALQRSLDHQLPLLPTFIALGKLRAKLRERSIFWGSIAGALLLLVLALWIIPANFTLSAQGALLPEQRRHLFAPHDGVVEQVLVEPGAEVARGQKLLELGDRKLEFELARVRGELETTQSRLATIRAKRSSRNKSAEQPEDPFELAAEEEQLKQKSLGLAQQLKILTATQASLTIVSPMQGQLMTWDAKDLLADRPVTRGQQLLTVADTAGPWILELQVADADVGHLLAAQEKQAELRVSFLLATDPSRTHLGTIARVATTSDAVDGKSPTALVLVKLDEPIAGVRSGAGVFARIDCGRRSLGYVWLHELFDAVRTRLLF